MAADEFLNTYKILEDSLEAHYYGKTRKYTSVIFEYINDDDSLHFREKLDLCREVRNLLSHNPKIDGENVIEPSSALTRDLEDIIKHVEKPPLAINFGTKSKDIFYANIDQKVFKVMERMERLGYSHVPVLDNGRFVGVFSHGTIFRYMLKSKNAINSSTSLYELKFMYDIKSHKGNYKFAARDVSVAEVRRIFVTVIQKNKRVPAVFITENGRPHEQILAMLTPWDVMVHK